MERRLLLSAWLTRRRGRLRLRLRFEIAERLLEQRGGRAVLLGLRSASVCGYVGWHVLLFARFARLVFFVLGRGRVRVAGVALHVRELPFVTIGVHVTILAPDNAVRAPGLLFEAAVVCLVTERKRTVIVQLVEVPDGLRRRLLLLLRLFLLLKSLLDELLRLWRSRACFGRLVLLSDDHLRLFFFVVGDGFLLLFACTLLQHPGRLSDHNHRLPFGFDVHLWPVLQRPACDQHRLELWLLKFIVGSGLLCVVLFIVFRNCRFHVHSSAIHIRRPQRYQK